ncbi:MAG: hypothetical protein RLN62_03360 [Rickettsiales bacterium]
MPTPKFMKRYTSATAKRGAKKYAGQGVDSPDKYLRAKRLSWYQSYANVYEEIDKALQKQDDEGKRIIPDIWKKRDEVADLLNKAFEEIKKPGEAGKSADSTLIKIEKSFGDFVRKAKVWGGVVIKHNGRSVTERNVDSVLHDIERNETFAEVLKIYKKATVEKSKRRAASSPVADSVREATVPVDLYAPTHEDVVEFERVSLHELEALPPRNLKELEKDIELMTKFAFGPMIAGEKIILHKPKFHPPIGREDLKMDGIQVLLDEKINKLCSNIPGFKIQSEELATNFMKSAEKFALASASGEIDGRAGGSPARKFLGEIKGFVQKTFERDLTWDEEVAIFDGVNKASKEFMHAYKAAENRSAAVKALQTFAGAAGQIAFAVTVVGPAIKLAQGKSFSQAMVSDYMMNLYDPTRDARKKLTQSVDDILKGTVKAQLVADHLKPGVYSPPATPKVKSDKSAGRGAR